jgi:hypothetical protein
VRARALTWRADAGLRGRVRCRPCVLAAECVGAAVASVRRREWRAGAGWVVVRAPAGAVGRGVRVVSWCVSEPSRARADLRGGREVRGGGEQGGGGR